MPGEIWPGMSREFFDSVRDYLGELCSRMRLRDWTVELSYEPDGEADHAASVEIPHGRRCASIQLARNFARKTPEEIRTILVHELVHCHLDAVDTTLSQVLPTMIGQVGWVPLRELLARDLEVATDQLSEVLAQFLPEFRPPPPPPPPAFELGTRYHQAVRDELALVQPGSNSSAEDPGA